jgi:hypothetical protein
MSRANKLDKEVNTLFKQIKTLENEVYPLRSRVENTYNRLRTDRPVTKPILFKHQLDEYEKLYKELLPLTKKLSKLHTKLQYKIQTQLNAEANHLKTSLRDRRNTTLLQAINKQLREMEGSMRNTQVAVKREKRNATKKKTSKPISPRTNATVDNAMIKAFTEFATSQGEQSSLKKKTPSKRKSVFGKGGALLRKSRKVRKSRKN